MIEVKIEGAQAVKAWLAGQQKQVRFGAALALTRLAGKVKDAMPAVMDQELDRPTTPFSKRGWFVRRATPATLTAIVQLMDRQASYLRWQIAGGVRQAGPRGIKLPGNIQLDTFGNIPRGVIAKLKAAAQDGRLGAALAKRINAHGNRRKGAAPLQLFLGRPTGRGWKKAPMGIWRRIPGSPGKLIPIVVFEDSPAKYRPRFRPQEAAREIVARRWADEFSASLADALRTAR
jgi:hypothetical protein